MTPADEKRIARLARAVCQALEGDLQIGRTLLAITDAETQALLANAAPRIEALQAQAKLLLEMQIAHGTERTRAMNALAAGLRMQPDEQGTAPPLSQMMLRLPLPETRRLAALREEILKVQASLHDTSARNRPLLENALDFVQYSLHVITLAAFRPNKYGPPQVTETPALLVNRTC